MSPDVDDSRGRRADGRTPASEAVPPSTHLAATHEVINQPIALAGYNLYESDPALRETVAREGAKLALLTGSAGRDERRYRADGRIDG